MAMAELRSQAAEIWQGLGNIQRITVGGVAIVSIALIAALLTWARTPEYATVFSNLTEEDAAAIVAKLKESKTPYELANGGTTIRVPASAVYDTRLQMASAGLPQGGGVGFEIFGQTNFGMTEFAEKVNYQRALEGELSRTINRLSPVEQSRVHIVIPQPTLYTDQQKETTASVVLKLKPGQQLKESQIKGIARLVSSSVEGLKPENLTIVDASGNVLSDSLATSEDESGLSSTRLETQRAFERNLEQRLQGMLDKVLGFGKASVQVQAVLDWDQYESSSETYSPPNTTPQVRSSQETIEKQSQLPTEVGGVPGTQSNLPSYTGVLTSATSTQGAYEKRETTTNYELSKTVEKSSKAPGSVKRLSVAVVLDGPAQADATQIENITKLVSAAAGIDTARGDVLAVSSIPFDRSAFASDAKAMEEKQQWETYLQLGRIGAMIIGPVLLLLLFYLVVFRRRPAGSYSVRQLPHNIKPGLAGPAAIAAIGQASGVETQSLEKPVEDFQAQPVVAEDPQHRFLREQVTGLVRTKPEVVAELVQNWLKEDGE